MEYPELPEVKEEDGVEIPQWALREMISGTLFAVGENENKPIITGSLIEIDNRTFRMVSVDGYRLAVRQEELEIGEDSYEIMADMITAKWGCRCVINYVGPVIGSHSGPGTLAIFFMGKER